MNRPHNTLSALRITCLVTLAMIGMVCMMSEPKEDSANWLLILLASKGIGAAALFGAWTLGTRWIKTDAWLQAYRDWCSKGMEDRL